MNAYWHNVDLEILHNAVSVYFTVDQRNHEPCADKMEKCCCICIHHCGHRYYH